jgi:adenosine kinase
MGCLGLHPLLVGAVGQDFEDYRSWLERHGVDCDSVAVSDLKHTARFVCTTDADHNQIASFYSGAMSEAREIELGPVAARVGGLDLVLVGANDPDAMIRHTDECRQRGIPFAADPSQQLARMHRDEIRQLIDGASYLFTNEYEAALTERKTGWSSGEILERVAVRVTTLGARGVLVERKGEAPVRVTCPPEDRKTDPTGVGDAFRAGFLAGVAWELPLERCAQIGSLIATYVIETVGTQEYEFGKDAFLKRIAGTYGDDASADIEPHLRCHRP